MLRWLVVLLCLLNASAVVMAHAADADVEAIKRAIVMDSAMTREDMLKVMLKVTGPEIALELTDLEDQSLTFMLFVFLASDKEKKQADFQPLIEGEFGPVSIANEVGRVRRRDRRLIPYEPMTCIHLDRITDCTCKIDGNTATGTVSFKVPGLYEGRSQFYAERLDGDWFICKFSMPSLDVDIARELRARRDGDGGLLGEEMVWRQRPAKR